MASMKSLLSRAAEIKEKITAKDIFGSETFKTFMLNVVNGLTTAFHGRATLTMYNGQANETACTDMNGNVRINLNNPFVQQAKKQKNYKEMFAVYVGLALHEIGHILFTPMRETASMIEGIMNGIRIPYNTPFLNSQIVNNRASRPVIANLLMQFLNIVEDAHIEYRLLDTFKGYADYLKHLRLLQFGEAIPISEYVENNTPTATVAFNLLLDFAKYGYLPQEDHPGKAVVETIKEEVEAAVEEMNGRKRTEILCVAFDKFFSLLYKQQKEENESQSSQSGQGQPQSGNSGQEQDSQSSNQNSSDGSDSSASKTQRSFGNGEQGSKSGEKPESEDESQSDDSNGSGQASDKEQDSEEGSQNGSKTDDESKNSTNGSPSGDNADSEKSDGSSSDGSRRGSDSEENDSPSEDRSSSAASGNDSAGDEKTGSATDGGGDSSSKSESSGNAESSDDSEQSNSSFSPDDLIKSLESSMDENAGNYSAPQQQKTDGSTDADSDTAIAEAFDHLAEDVAEQMAADEEQAERINGLNTLKADMDFSKFHKNVIGRVDLVPSTPNEAVLSQLKEYNAVARRLTQETARVLEDMREGDVEKGLYFGSRLDRAYSADKKYFKRYKAEEDVPDMSIVILVDESGSMRGSRMDAVRRTTFVLAEACSRLKIRLAVYGHNDGEDWCNITKINVYKDFDDCDGRTLDRLSNMRAHNARNRDGWAQRFCVERLKKEDSKRKLMIILSDGAPNGEGYGYSYIPPESRTASYKPEHSGNAKVDIQEILGICYKNHIKVVSAGIGEDAKCLSDIYSDGMSKRMAATFLQIDDLDELTPQLVKIIKKLVLA